MLPICINLERSNITLIGRGRKLYSRMKKLDTLGGGNIKMFDLDKVNSALPTENILRNSHLVLGVDLYDSEKSYLSEMAEKHKILLNIEDQKSFCDFYFCSFVERGPLQLAINTRGKIPGLSRLLRTFLSETIPQEWSPEIEHMAQTRKGLIQKGISSKTIFKELETLFQGLTKHHPLKRPPHGS
jgi:siroheme synthase-like protein